MTTKSKKGSSQRPPRIIMLPSGLAWSSAIRQQMESLELNPSQNLVVAIDMDDLIVEAKSHLGSVAVIELNQKNVLPTCRLLHDVVNNPWGLQFFSAGQPGFRENEPWLRKVGFTACFWSVVHTERLVDLAVKLANHWPEPAQTIEQYAWANLPWNPTSE